MNRKVRAISLAATALAAVLGLGSGPAEAAPAPSTAAAPGPACTAIDAPPALNPIPASADCPSSPTAVAKPATATAAVVSPSTPISSTPKSFDSTDGDILAITKVAGASPAQLAIGGNFHHVITPDGVGHAATNFAVINESTGAVLYAGNANSYVRAITSYAGTVYLGGDFTSFGGVSRAHAAALSPTHTITSWNPAPAQRVRGMAADSSGVYLGGDLGALRKVSLSSGGTLWSKGTSGGAIKAIMVTGGYVYAGGLFETYNGTTQHGLVKVNPSNGALITAFNAHLRADTGIGTYGQYDGEEAIALSPGMTSTTIVLGIGGHAPPGLSSNETIVVNSTTGARVWRVGTIGDTQAVGIVGDTVVIGYHRNTANGSIPWPYFCAQLEYSNGALTSWDPKITGDQSNADGGNNGVQAIYSDPSINTIFIAGAFTHWNGTATHQSLIAFGWF